MNAKHGLMALSLIAVLGAPVVARADSVWHPNGNELGATLHPDHQRSDTSRAQVRAEAGKLRGSEVYPDGLPVARRDAGSALSRAEVVEALRRQSPAERREREARYPN